MSRTETSRPRGWGKTKGHRDDYFDDNIPAIARDRAAAIQHCIGLAATLAGPFAVETLEEWMTPGTSVRGIGGFKFPLSHRDVTAVLRKYPNGSIYPKDCDHAHEGFHPWLEKQVNEKMATDLAGVNDPSLEFVKIAISGKGNHWTDNKHWKKVEAVIRLAVLMPSEHRGGNLELFYGERETSYSSDNALDTVSLVAWYPHAELSAEPVTTGSCVAYLYAIHDPRLKPTIPTAEDISKLNHAFTHLYHRKKLIAIPMGPPSHTGFYHNIYLRRVIWDIIDRERKWECFTVTLRVRQDGWTDEEDVDARNGSCVWEFTQKHGFCNGETAMIDGREDEAFSALRAGKSVNEWCDHPVVNLFCTRDDFAENKKKFLDNLPVRGDVPDEEEYEPEGFAWEREFSVPAIVLVPNRKEASPPPEEPESLAPIKEDDRTRRLRNRKRGRRSGGDDSDREWTGRATRTRKAARRTPRPSATGRSSRRASRTAVFSGEDHEGDDDEEFTPGTAWNVSEPARDPVATYLEKYGVPSEESSGAEDEVRAPGRRKIHYRDGIDSNLNERL